MKVLAICGEGLGYKSWLKVDTFGVNDCLLLPCGTSVARCHPVIQADNWHEDNLDGVVAGDLICGVRWCEPYKGQPVVNPPQIS